MRLTLVKVSLVLLFSGAVTTAGVAADSKPAPSNLCNSVPGGKVGQAACNMAKDGVRVGNTSTYVKPTYNPSTGAVGVQATCNFNKPSDCFTSKK